ncbi:MAG: hypothetical protein H0X69_08830 [Gemmatimonadales bacterium]|nr:hypothetical protein [Gemmatimonadales bacterium]
MRRAAPPVARTLRHVLVATDFSAGAGTALSRLRYLPLAPRAEINPTASGRRKASARARYHRECREQARDAVTELIGESSAVTVVRRVSGAAGTPGP